MRAELLQTSLQTVLIQVLLCLFLCLFQASFLNKRLNIDNQRVNIAIWVSQLI